MILFRWITRLIFLLLILVSVGIVIFMLWGLFFTGPWNIWHILIIWVIICNGVLIPVLISFYRTS